MRIQFLAFIFATDWFLKLYAHNMQRNIFQAIANPTGRAMIALLALHARIPNVLVEQLNSCGQADSKHVRIWSEYELIKQQPKG